MSNCSEHKKDLFGQTDMKLVAEAIGDLHYETLFLLFKHLETKFLDDYKRDRDAGRDNLAMRLWDAAIDAGCIASYMQKAWQISKPFMESNKTVKT